MKLISVNAVLIVSVNISLFVKNYNEYQIYPPITLFCLSFIYIALLILLEYQHRQFKTEIISITESSSLFRKYLYLFAGGIILVLTSTSTFIDTWQHNINNYILLGPSKQYTFLYHGLNFFLGFTYLFLFQKEYKKANKSRIQCQPADNSLSEQNCAICLSKIEEGQKLAKINCMHHFHASCLNKWIKRKQQCPLCLSKISLID